jgi:16S rRNA (guanine966-N2)-methyltransferase
MRRGVRLGAGHLKGKIVAVGRGVRPTSSRVREALFDVLGPRVAGARVLDLFAGSGALGLEALSRGAAEVVLVEADSRVVRALRRTTAALAGSRGRVVRLLLPRQLDRLAALDPLPFDLILADPPYRFGQYGQLLRGAASLLAPDGVLVLEHGADEEAPAKSTGLTRTTTRRYGESCLSFYELSSPAGGTAGSQARK